MVSFLLACMESMKMNSDSLSIKRIVWAASAGVFIAIFQ